MLIVDDEELGRKRIQQLLKDESDFCIKGLCENGQQAIEWLRSNSCDLVFLDIQMPEVDGLDVVQQLGPGDMPLVVFVTAFDQFAVEAFRVHALDYLLKPVDRELFQQSLQRIKQALTATEAKDYFHRLDSFINEQKRTSSIKNKYISVKQGERIHLIQYADIRSVVADANYIVIKLHDQQYRIRETMHGFVKKSSHQPFIQINRSTVINIEHIKEIQPYFKGEYVVLMDNGQQHTTGAKYRLSITSLIA